MRSPLLIARKVLLPLLLLPLGIPGCTRNSADAGVGTRLRFWNGFTGPDGKTMEKLVSRFQRENPGIRVDMQIIPWAQYYDKLTLGLAFDKGPQVFICHANRLPEFAQHKAFKPLDSLLGSSEGLPTSDFVEQAWMAAKFENAAYGVPLDCHPIGLYYNRKLFREAGVVDSHGEAAPPRTYEEFIAAGKKLTRDVNHDGRPEQWAFAFTWLHSNWYTFAFQHGGSSLTPDLSRSAMAGDAALAATRQMREIVDVHRVAPRPEGVDAWLGFRQGRVAMALEGIYMLADLEKTANLDYGGAPVPQFGPRRAAWAGSHMICLPARLGPADTPSAWKFVRFLSENSLDWAAGGQVPARKSLIRTERFRRMRVQSAFAGQLSHVSYEPASPSMTEISPFVTAAIEAAMLGLKSPEAAMAEAAARINRVLARP